MPRWLAGLVDDAAIFPPGNLPLPEALAAHREHRAAPYAGLVGPFVVSDTRLPDLLDEVSDDVDPLPVSVVVTGGAGAVEPAVRWATRSGALTLRSLEVLLRDDDTGAIVHNARRILAAVDQVRAGGDLDDEVPVHVEPPRLYGAPPTAGWLGALDEVAAADLRLKFRTGGADADAFPAAHELAASIQAALDREVGFKCTAGLHHALRHRDPQNGFDHPVDQHGFLNVLVATAHCLRGADVDDMARVLEEQAAERVLGWLAALATDGELERARRWFTSFGSCSVLEPVTDLLDLDLLPDLPRERP